MNIERWLYPRPETKWTPKDYDGELIWIPVYSQTFNAETARERERVVNLKSLNTREEDGLGQNIRPSLRSSTYSNSTPTDAFTHNRYKVDELSENSQYQEVNKVYRTSIGLPEFDSQSTKQYSTQSRGGHVTKEAPDAGLFESMFVNGKTENIKPALPQFTAPSQRYHKDPLSNVRFQGDDTGVIYKIPCMYHKQNQYQTKIMIYFHSNAEDINLCYDFCRHLMVQLNVCVLAVEYPGYSCFVGQETSEELICENAERVFDFLVAEAGISPSILSD